MTKEEILAMEAGRKLDKLVHEDVMKQCWHDWVAEQSDSNVTGVICSKCRSKPIYAQGMVNYPLYSIDISAAWQVVEKMEELGWGFTLVTSDRVARCFPLSFNKPSSKWVIGKKIPEAICKAALIAKLNSS